MPTNPKLPATVEIKRVIAATLRVGVEIGSIEIHADKITIHSRHPTEPELGAYDLWKMSLGEGTERIRRDDGESVSLPREPRG